MLVFLIAGCCFTPSRLVAQKTVGKKVGEERSDNKMKIKFCWCPPGKFKMGSPRNEFGRASENQVDVTLTRGFWLGKLEVYQGQYQNVMGTNPSYSQGIAKPVERVNWDEATEFCTELTRMEREAGRLPQGWEYRLPTEAQWEYACRAETTTAYSFGNDAKQLFDYAWYRDNSQKTHVVGKKKPNAWGLHDMHGNVWEWCRDWYDPNLPGGTDPEVTKRASFGVFRGGSWHSGAGLCRSAYRRGSGPVFRSGDLGFRLALVQSGG